jgi:hypothetical protein
VSTGPDWGEQARRLMDGVRGVLAEPARIPEGTGHAAECRWCPLCQAIAVVRGERPEVSAALADLLTTAAAALRSVAAEPGAGPAAAPATEAAADPDGSVPDGSAQDDTGEPPPAVQRIEIA